jgi:MFS family permease
MPSDTSYNTRQGKNALAFRSFRYFLIGAFISSIGTWIQATSLLWFVRQYTSANDTLVAVINMATWVPVLFFGFFAGAVADHLDRRRLIVTCQFIMLASSVLIGLGLTVGFTPFWLLVTVVAIGGIGYALFVIAWVAIQPCLVSREALLDAVAWNNTQFNLARFIGPIIGGLILTWWLPGAFYLNALTFFTFITLIYLSKARVEQPPPGRGKILDKVSEGIRYVIDTRWMGRVLLALAGISFFGFSFMVLMPAVCKQMLHAGNVRYGVLFGMTGLGAVLGMWAITMLNRKIQDVNILRVSAIAATGLLVAFSFSRIYWLSCVLAFGLGASFLVFTAEANGMLMNHARPDMQGRVSSMWVVMFLGVYPVGGLLLGILCDYMGAHAALLIGGIGCGLVTLALFLVPIAREEHRREVLLEKG